VRHLVAGALRTYMEGMSKKALFVVISLVLILVAAVYSTSRMWTSIGSDGPGINANGITALILGGIGTLALGGGLMALVFYSSRRGYDDAADFKRDPNDP
jgi:hypothetical protein